MLTVIELREKAVQEAEAARAIKDTADQETRGLTAEEALKFDQHLVESERLEKEAERQEKLESAEKRLNEPAKRKVPGETATGDEIRIETPSLFRFGELRAFTGPKATANAYRAGRFIAAVIFGHAKSRQWCNEHGIEIRVDKELDS